MFESSQLLGFLIAATVLVLIPGPNTMLILAHSFSGGRSAGVVTAIGVEVGTVIHTMAAALGLSVILSTSALAFNVVKYAGAAYLILLGVRALIQKQQPLSATTISGVGRSAAFWRACATNVLNPKVAIFFLAFLPQFVQPERGNLVLQFIVLGLIVATVGLLWGSIIAFGAGSIGARLTRNQGLARWQSRLTGTVLLGLGVRLAFARQT